MTFMSTTYRRMSIMLTACFVMMMLAVPAFAQTGGLGEVARTEATGAVADAVLVAGVIIGFAVLYKIIRKVTGS
jgi:hypothetical protein